MRNCQLMIHTLSTDVVYFDFSNAFDSVNHDNIIIDKLKYSYFIDGRLLKFLKNYLCEREQSVVLDGVKSSSKPVLSLYRLSRIHFRTITFCYIHK